MITRSTQLMFIGCFMLFNCLMLFNCFMLVHLSCLAHHFHLLLMCQSILMIRSWLFPIHLSWLFNHSIQFMLIVPIRFQWLFIGFKLIGWLLVSFRQFMFISLDFSFVLRLVTLFVSIIGRLFLIDLVIHFIKFLLIIKLKLSLIVKSCFLPIIREGSFHRLILHRFLLTNCPRDFLLHLSYQFPSLHFIFKHFIIRHFPFTALIIQWFLLPLLLLNLLEPIILLQFTNQFPLALTLIQFLIPILHPNFPPLPSPHLMIPPLPLLIHQLILMPPIPLLTLTLHLSIRSHWSIIPTLIVMLLPLQSLLIHPHSILIHRACNLLGSIRTLTTPIFIIMSPIPPPHSLIINPILFAFLPFSSFTDSPLALFSPQQTSLPYSFFLPSSRTRSSHTHSSTSVHDARNHTATPLNSLLTMSIYLLRHLILQSTCYTLLQSD